MTAPSWSPQGMLAQRVPELGLLRTAPGYPAALAAAARELDADDLVYLAWELVSALGAAAEERTTREPILLALALLLAEREGSTQLPADRGALAAELARLLSPCGVSEAEVRDVCAWLGDGAGLAAFLVGPAGSARPIARTESALAVQRLVAQEARIAGRAAQLLRPLSSAPAAAAVARAQVDLAARPSRKGDRPVALSPEQEAAVAAAVRGGLTLISGGPGTGKTSIVVAVLRTLTRLGLSPRDLALAAPTGKAADRLQQSVAAALRSVAEPDPADAALAESPVAAQTLHRLLGYSPSRDRFRHGEASPLPHAAVIVDEASMIDLSLMDRLLAAVRPGARLVFLGDGDQLPSVGAGAAFRELLSALPAERAVRLTHSYRMDAADPDGARVLSWAQSIQRGEARPELAELRAVPADVTFRGAERIALSQPAMRQELLAAWHDRVLCAGDPAGFYQQAAQPVRFGAGGPGASAAQAVRALLAQSQERGRLLCPQREGPAGSLAVSHELLLHALAAAGQPTVAVRGRASGQVDPALWPPGTPLLVRRNDYARGLFNGDAGVVLQVSFDGEEAAPCGVFAQGDELRAFPLAALAGEVELAFALTVHKAQGSEVARVLLLLPDRDTPLLTREILYTGLTRARLGAAVAGPPALFELGVSRKLARRGGLAQALAAPLAFLADRS